MSAATSHSAANAYVLPSSVPGVSERAAFVPWYIWMGVVAVTSANVGGAWDVSWHRSIGRDSFWTPAHMAIYACGLLSAIVCSWLIVQCTLGRDAELRATSVSIFGLRAPLGVFLAGWGGVMMMTSAPFDNWWHNAYGLDVKIVSPPHVVLILGARGVSIGMLFLILANMNRAAASGAASFRPLQRLFLYLGGLAVCGQMFFLQEFTSDALLHQAMTYVALAIGVPVVFSMLSEASQSRWAATFAAGVYTLFVIAEIQILPLVPAQPKLGPVYHAITHLVPAKFPILILVPALALDLLWQRIGGWKQWQIALTSGAVFVAVLVAVEWPFANFLMSHASENRFFGTTYSSYYTRPQSYDRLRIFLAPDHGLVLALVMLRAAVYAAVSTWIGLAFGRWMRSVKR